VATRGDSALRSRAARGHGRRRPHPTQRAGRRSRAAVQPVGRRELHFTLSHEEGEPQRAVGGLVGSACTGGRCSRLDPCPLRGVASGRHWRKFWSRSAVTSLATRGGGAGAQELRRAYLRLCSFPPPPPVSWLCDMVAVCCGRGERRPRLCRRGGFGGGKMRALMPPFYPRAPVGSPLRSIGSCTNAASVGAGRMLCYLGRRATSARYFFGWLPCVAVWRTCAVDPTWVEPYSLHPPVCKVIFNSQGDCVWEPSAC
jgi:hypothetical protein